jgi:hypothetical protein
MKASLDASGKMTITAEGGVEHYALHKWWADWLTNKAVLQVEYASESDPSKTEVKPIRNEQ